MRDPIERYINEIAASHGDLAGPRLHYDINRRLITGLVSDVIGEGTRRLQRLGATDCDGIRNAAAPVIAFSPAMTADLDELRAFLFTEVYRSERVMTVMRQAEGMVAELFARYLAEPSRLPEGCRLPDGSLTTSSTSPRTGRPARWPPRAARAGPER